NPLPACLGRAVAIGRAVGAAVRGGDAAADRPTDARAHARAYARAHAGADARAHGPAVAGRARRVPAALTPRSTSEGSSCGSISMRTSGRASVRGRWATMRL